MEEQVRFSEEQRQLLLRILMGEMATCAPEMRPAVQEILRAVAGTDKVVYVRRG